MLAATYGPDSVVAVMLLIALLRRCLGLEWRLLLDASAEKKRMNVAERVQRQ